MAVPFDGSRAPFHVLEDIGTVLAFDWQPDGQGVVAAVQGIADYPHNVLWEVFLGQDNNPQLLLPDARPAYNDYPRYSADGRWLAFRSAYELIVIDTTDDTLHSFGLASANNSPPLWSPPGFQGEQACQ
jgi:Tol biopolymer transport system component